MSPDRAIQGTFGPIYKAPTVVDDTASTTAALLTADLDDDQMQIVRRVLIANLDGTDTIALLMVERGSSLTGLGVADGLKIPPNQFRSVNVGAAVRLGIVASANTPAFNAVISDI